MEQICYRLNFYVAYLTYMLYHALRDKQPIKTLARTAWLHVRVGPGGHLLVRRGNRMSVLPMHGSSKELGTGLVKKIKKDLGLQDR